MEIWTWVVNGECVIALTQYDGWREICKNNPTLQVNFEDVMGEEEADEFLEHMVGGRWMIIR
jgi:hypothetical protein